MTENQKCPIPSPARGLNQDSTQHSAQGHPQLLTVSVVPAPDRISIKAERILAFREQQLAPLDLLKEAVATFGDKISLACSFSMEDVALVHMLTKVTRAPKIFALDTGRLPEETYECAELLRRRYGLSIQWYLPDALQVQEMTAEKGLYSFRQSLEERKQCCFIRKVLPLRQALAPLDAWITGQRRQQSETRQDLLQVEVDHAHGSIIKLNPLFDWTFEQVRQYVDEHKIPYNRLYDRGYTSIGCSPCTRAISPGEHERAGRWWWESAEHKECGLHLAQ